MWTLLILILSGDVEVSRLALVTDPPYGSFNACQADVPTVIDTVIPPDGQRIEVKCDGPPRKPMLKPGDIERSIGELRGAWCDGVQGELRGGLADGSCE